MQTVASGRAALRRVSRRELRALPRIGTGLAVNLLLAFGWILFSPLEYTDRNKISVIIVYFVTFVLADSATTNMFADQARRQAGEPHRYGKCVALVVVRNVTLFVALGAPLLIATAVLVILSDRPALVPFAMASVSVQVLVWLGVCSILATAFPVARVGPRGLWNGRREVRTTVLRLASMGVPYLVLWVLLPADEGRRRLPGLGAVHRRTPGAQGMDHLHQALGAVVAALTIWLICVLIGAAIARHRAWRAWV
ncbi:hypothetical protein [Tsukamurella strandjordii]|uniref:Uncharacterized protein n=1 Tax=Tsukamurella strandjordii TaxID=147577 RepID=A0AA90NRD2_9ACTN|nr:hypothetical protein [Tsukamurella strandjordii]MDP0399379.1 hypothetical protein [Tsukamurella strandjordii]